MIRALLFLSVFMLGCVPPERQKKADSYVGTTFCIGNYKYMITECHAFMGDRIDECRISIPNDPLRLLTWMPITAIDALLTKVLRECP